MTYTVLSSFSSILSLPPWISPFFSSDPLLPGFSPDFCSPTRTTFRIKVYFLATNTHANPVAANGVNTIQIVSILLPNQQNPTTGGGGGLRSICTEDLCLEGGGLN